jgi:hypothetical protein
LIKKFYIILVFCFYRRFRIKFGQLFSNNILLPDENVLRNYITLIHKLRALGRPGLLVVDENEYNPTLSTTDDVGVADVGNADRGPGSHIVVEVVVFFKKKENNKYLQFCIYLQCTKCAQ